MSDAWQLAESFERTRQLITAVNTVSVHVKLSSAGVPDLQSEEEVRHATAVLRDFLSKLANDLSSYDKDSGSPVTGATVRSNMLTRRFALARGQSPEVSPIYSISLSSFVALLESSDRSDQAQLVSGLQTLRNLLEQHHHSDSNEMFGNL